MHPNKFPRRQRNGKGLDQQTVAPNDFYHNSNPQDHDKEL